MNLAVHSESNNILSFRSYFHSKGGTFFETPSMSFTNSSQLLENQYRSDLRNLSTNKPLTKIAMLTQTDQSQYLVLII